MDLRKSAFCRKGSYMAAISRRAARECAVKTLYSYDFHLEMPAEDFFAATCEECELPYNDFARELFLGAVSHKASIDEKISAYAKGWSLDRIAHISLAILRLCTYELLFTEVPTPVAINEAVELAKLYDGDDAPAFINGILNAIASRERETKA